MNDKLIEGETLENLREILDASTHFFVNKHKGVSISALAYLTKFFVKNFPEEKEIFINNLKSYLKERRIKEEG